MSNKLKKPPAVTGGPKGPDSSLELDAQRVSYGRTTTGASPKHLRLVHDNGLKARVLGRAARQVREQPQTLALWAFRLSQHVSRGTFGFREAWDLLQAAAIDGGTREASVTRILYHALSDSMTTAAAPMPLTVLAGGVQ